MQFPVFHAGVAPLDSKGRGMVAQIDVPIRCGGVSVNPGDLVVGDADGVVVVPQAIEIRALNAAFAKVTGEDRTIEVTVSPYGIRRSMSSWRCSTDRSATFMLYDSAPVSR